MIGLSVGKRKVLKGMKALGIFLALLCMIIVVGCGGGGGNSEGVITPITPPVTPPVTPPDDSFRLDQPTATGIEPVLGYYPHKDTDGTTYTFLRVTQDSATGKKYADCYDGQYWGWRGLVEIIDGAFYRNSLIGWSGYAISGHFTTPTHIEVKYKFRDYNHTTDSIHYSVDLDE